MGRAQRNPSRRSKRRERWVSLRSTHPTSVSNGRYESAFSRHELPELCVSFRPHRRQRAQGKPGAGCTRGSRATKSTGVGPQVNRSIPAFPAQWFTAYFALSQVTGLSCHLHLRKVSRKLERQHRGVRTTRLHRPPSSGVRLSPSSASTASRRNVRDVRTSPLIGRDAQSEITDLPDDGSEIFCARGWTGFC